MTLPGPHRVDQTFVLKKMTGPMLIFTDTVTIPKRIKISANELALAYLQIACNSLYFTKSNVNCARDAGAASAAALTAKSEA